MRVQIIVSVTQAFIVQMSRLWTKCSWASPSKHKLLEVEFSPLHLQGGFSGCLEERSRNLVHGVVSWCLQNPWPSGDTTVCNCPLLKVMSTTNHVKLQWGERIPNYSQEIWTQVVVLGKSFSSVSLYVPSAYWAEYLREILWGSNKGVSLQFWKTISKK